MILDCGKENFEKGGKYRVLVEYGINNTVIRRKEGTKQLSATVYVEPHIYQIFDEYDIKY